MGEIQAFRIFDVGKRSADVELCEVPTDVPSPTSPAERHSAVMGAGRFRGVMYGASRGMQGNPELQCRGLRTSFYCEGFNAVVWDPLKFQISDWPFEALACQLCIPKGSDMSEWSGAYAGYPV